MKQFNFIGSDYSDYWPGYHLPVVVVSVLNPMTNKEMEQSINEELNYYYDLYEEWENNEDKALIQRYRNELLENPDDIFIDPEYDELYTEDMEGMEINPINCYFSFCNPKTVGGINFLN